MKGSGLRAEQTRTARFVVMFVLNPPMSNLGGSFGVRIVVIVTFHADTHYLKSYNFLHSC